MTELIKTNFKQRMTQSMRAGFSLIELMIAITILGIIMALVAPRFMGYLGKAKVRSARVMIQTLKNAITMYKADVGEYPVKLRDLLKKPSEERHAKRWEGPYLDQPELPEDPWSNSYKYERTQSGYDIYSTGDPATAEDKSQWIRAE